MSYETEEQSQKRIHDIRVKTQALALIQRGKNSGMPERYLRVGPSSFMDTLSIAYHGGKEGVKKITDLVYKTPLELAKIPFIVIDGGKIETRKKMGCAILFRLIACDKFGLYKDCTDMVHKMQSFISEQGISRNDFTNALKSQEVVFVSEFKKNIFSQHLDAGSYFDEFLGYRMDNLKPTIISFTNEINSTNVFSGETCGEYLAAISKKEYANPKDKKENPTKNVLRIRCKDVVSI